MSLFPPEHVRPIAVCVLRQDERITVENVPGYITRVNAAMYEAMKQAMLEVLPTEEPGLTQAEIRNAATRNGFIR